MATPLVLTGWTPIQLDAAVDGRVTQRSVIAEVARRRPMTSNQQDVPRFADADVNGGSQLTDDTNVGDVASMFSYQYNGKATLDQATTEDTVPNEIESYSAEWLNSFNIAYDNASIGVSGTRSSTVGDFRPYKSIYQAVRSNDNTGAITYAADANYVNGSLSASGTGQQAAYRLLSAGLGKVEGTEFWTEESGIIILHPSLKESIRNIMGTDGRPIFVESTAGVAGGGVRTVYTLFGIEARFSLGAIVSNNFKRAVTSNKLIVFANRNYLVHGPRIDPSVRFIDAATNRTALEHTIQTRARKGFVLTVPNSCAVVEITP